MKVVAIDLGSNTLRVVKYDCKNHKVIAEYEKIVRTANSIVKNGTIDVNAESKIISGLLEAKDSINFDNCIIKAVTTEAMRVASNSLDVLKSIQEKTGIDFDVINSTDEAIYTLKAVQNRLDILNIDIKDFVLVDIGGGSTEITFCINSKIYTKSFPLGIVTVANSINSLEDIEKILEEKIKDISAYVKEYLKYDLSFIATAGTPTTIASMKLGFTYETYNANAINGVELKIEELDFYLEKLLAMSKEDKEKTVGVGRDDLILAGILIFKKLYIALNMDISIVVDDGLREGVALSICK